MQRFQDVEHLRYKSTKEPVCGQSAQAYWPPDFVREMIGDPDHTGNLYHTRLFTDAQVQDAVKRSGKRCTTCLMLFEHFGAPADDSEPERYPGAEMTRAIQIREQRLQQAKEGCEG